MAGSVLVIILLPIVLAVALTIWIFAVFHANRHPEPGQGMLLGWLSRRTRVNPGRLPQHGAAPGQAPDDQGGGTGSAPAVSQGQQRDPMTMRRPR
jgi:hypothetical protein